MPNKPAKRKPPPKPSPDDDVTDLEPTAIESAQQFRKFIRQYCNSAEGRQRIKMALGKSDKILGLAMTIAAGNISEDGSNSSISTTNMIFIENILQMGPEAMKRYADTGELAAGPTARTIELPVSTTGAGDGSDPTWTAAEAAIRSTEGDSVKPV